MASDYFGLPAIVSLIFLIIPFTAWICGVITRIMDKCFVAAIIRFFFFGYIIWIIELVLCIINGCKVEVWRLIKV